MARKKHNPNQMSFFDYLDAMSAPSNGHGKQKGNGVVHSEELSMPDEDVDIDKLSRYAGLDKLVGRYYRMAKETEEILVAKAQGGCLRSRDRLVVHNLGFILQTLAKLYPWQDATLLLGAGCEGMIKAIERFDVTKGFRLITYASHWIRQAAHVEKKDDVLISRPHYYPDLLRKVRNRMVESDESFEIACRSLDISERMMAILREEHEGVRSLDKVIGDDSDGVTLGELLADQEVPLPDYELERREIAARVQECVNLLDRRSKHVIRRRFGFYGQKTHKLQEIAAELGLSRERVRQIERDAFMKLTRHFARRGIKRSIIEA